MDNLSSADAHCKTAAQRMHINIWMCGVNCFCHRNVVTISYSAWPSGLGGTPSCFTAHKFDGSRVQIPGVDTVNQAVHPSGVGKLVALSMQWVTAAEDCEV
jgi:hypothetical protein